MSYQIKPAVKITRGVMIMLAICIYGLGATIFTIYYILQTNSAENQIKILAMEKRKLSNELLSTRKAYTGLKNEDQYKINQRLKKDINNIHTLYSSLSASFENIQDLKAQKQKANKLEDLYVSIVKDLSDLNYASAESKLTSLNGQIKKINDDLAAAYSASVAIAQATASNVAPNSGYSYQSVKTEIGDFTVSIVAADLNSTRVIVDTAAEADCRDNCPVLSLGDYAGRSGAFAGINGSYFCPASYPSCVGKTNSYDTLVMNKNKKYFNSDNNVYSTVPVAVFGAGWARFMGRSLDWGRDTSIDGVIANQPLLISSGNIAFGGNDDPKQGSRGSRSFVGNKGSIVYIGVVYNATVAQAAYVLKALGFENAMNLDSGGSTALWYGGYKAGPGRNIPNVILFVRR